MAEAVGCPLFKNPPLTPATEQSGQLPQLGPAGALQASPDEGRSAKPLPWGHVPVEGVTSRSAGEYRAAGTVRGRVEHLDD